MQENRVSLPFNNASCCELKDVAVHGGHKRIGQVEIDLQPLEIRPTEPMFDFVSDRIQPTERTRSNNAQAFDQTKLEWKVLLGPSQRDAHDVNQNIHLAF